MMDRRNEPVTSILLVAGLRVLVRELAISLSARVGANAVDTQLLFSRVAAGDHHHVKDEGHPAAIRGPVASRWVVIIYDFYNIHKTSHEFSHVHHVNVLDGIHATFLGR